MPLSPGSVPSRLSPRSPISPNINPFAPLSPDLPHAHLVNMPSMHQADQRRSLRTYTRQSLLHIAKRCKKQGWTKPAGMAELGSWYGPMTGGSRHTHDDPAIASIDPAPSTSANRRNGPVGFGEGFGFGGGIGSGRGIGKSGRSIGSRTTEAPAEASEAGSSRRPQNAMGRFALRGNGDRAGPSEPTKHGSDRNLRRDDGEWRRPAHNTNETHKRNGPNWSHRPAYENDSVEPAWMADDSAPAALQAGSELSDSRHSNPLSPPGFDAPAPFRFRGDDSRRPEKTLVSFFDTLEGSSNQPPPMPAYPVQVKTFNAADYLKSAQNAAEVQEPAQPAGGFSSRFQKFFGSGAASDPVAANANFATTSSVSSPNPITSPPPESATHKADDHMAKLMGMLSTRPTPAPEYSPTDRQRGEAVSLPVQDHHYQPYPTSAYGFPNQSRIESQPSSTSGHQNFTSPPPQALYHQSPATVHRSDLPAPYGGYQGGFPANSQQHPNLAPVNHPASFAPVNPAPQFAPNGPGRASPQDLLRHLQRVPPGPPGGQYYAPPPPGQFPQYLEHEAQSAGNHHVYHQQNPPFMQQRSDSGNRFVPPHHLAEYDQKGPPAIFPNPGNPPSRNLNMAQQDMLAALFAGLPGSSHPNQ